MARWDKIKHRGNIEDRRGAGPAMIGGIGTMGIVLVLAVGVMSGGEDALKVLRVLEEVNSVTQTQSYPSAEFAGEDDYEVFASTVLGSSDVLWKRFFAASGLRYQPSRLVLFRGATQSGCGGAHSSIGPHYCPLDKTIYLDETFFDELTSRLGAKGGDVAEAYVIAHEVGHHVQNLLGTSDRVRAAQGRRPSQKNALSVKQELQADCYAGVWANSIAHQNIFEANEISEAIDAAEAVGDDRIQKRSTGRTYPETWTHGSSADRKKWFSIGYTSGNPNLCDTFE